MKLFWVVLMLSWGLTARAQEATGNAFEEAFEDMFQIQQPDWEAIATNTPPDPPVPVDGGLVALLGAGAAVGYRRFRRARGRA